MQNAKRALHSVISFSFRGDDIFAIKPGREKTLAANDA